MGMAFQGCAGRYRNMCDIIMKKGITKERTMCCFFQELVRLRGVAGGTLSAGKDSGVAQILLSESGLKIDGVSIPEITGLVLT